MIDPALNRRLENCKKLMLLWRRYHEFMNDCAKGKDFTQQDEAEFLRLKSQIAILHDSFLESVDTNKATAQSVISLVERCILLRQVAKTNAAELKKMEIEWHESYMLLNETIGSLQEKVDHLATVSRISFESARIIDRTTAKVTRVLTSRGFQFAVGAIAIIGAAVILPMMGVYNYDFLRKWSITDKVYIAARALLRGSVMGDLEFLEYEDYAKHVRQDMPNGVNKADIPENQKEALKDAIFLKKLYPGFELDISSDVRAAKYNNIEKYSASGDVYVFLVMFDKTSVAKDMLQKIEAWKKNIPVNSAADKVEQQIKVGRVNNILYMLQGQDSGTLDSVKKTLEKQ